MKNKKARLYGALLPIAILMAAAGAAILFLLPDGLKAVNEGSKGYGPFDMHFSYTPDNLMTILSHFKGNKQEVFSSYFLLDYIFAGLCFPLMLILPLFIYSFSDRFYLLFRASVFSALFYEVFNAAENILLMRMINVSPVFTDSDATFSSGCTTIKWIFLVIWIVSVLLFAVTTAVSVNLKPKARRFK